MIRTAGAKADGTPFVMLGLENENLRRLTAGEPIRVNLRRLDPAGPPVGELPDLELVIFHADGETLRQLRELVDGSAGAGTT